MPFGCHSMRNMKHQAVTLLIPLLNVTPEIVGQVGHHIYTRASVCR